MIGAIIGDIAGSRFEFNNHRSKEFELFTDDCFVTDDSIMTLAVAKAIMENAKTQQPLSSLAIRYMQEIGRKYPRCGYGARFFRWVASNDPKPYGSYGNGAAMRVSPAGFAAGSEEDALLLAETVTAVTHDHPEGIKGAKATALAIFIARQGAGKNEIRDRMAGYYDLGFTINDIRGTYNYDITCQGTVPQAIVAYLESGSFEDAIRTAVSLGGDSDTLAAITGSIAEAYFGVPPEIKEKALAYLDGELRGIYDEWVTVV